MGSKPALSLRNILLLIVGILFLALIISEFLLVRSEQQALSQLYGDIGTSFARGFLNSLKHDMVAGETREVRDAVKALAEADLIDKAKIIDSEGKIWASNKPIEIGTLETSPHTLSVLRTGTAATAVEQRDSGSVRIISVPIVNEPQCRTCHSAEQPLLGVLEINLTRKPVESVITSQVVSVTVVGGIITLVMVFILFYIFRQRVYRPLSARISQLVSNGEEKERLYATDRLASIGELSAGIAHEINNPLTSIIGFSDLLLQQDAGVSQEVKEKLSIINTEALRTAEIVKGLLTFARRHPVNKQPVSVNDLMNNILNIRKYEQEVNNITVNADFAADLLQVNADPFQLQQVFLNIIINAEYFMKEARGKGTLTITTENQPSMVHIAIGDDGPGISPENITHIFTPFFTTKEVGKGTGLGLSIAYGIVTEHNGRITVESKLGKGATFHIFLPAVVSDDGLPLV